MFLAPFGRWEWSLKEGFHPISHLGLQHSLVDGLHYGEGAILNMDVVIVPPCKSYRLIISAPSPMCSRAKTTLVWAPLILLLAFADQFLNEWNLDSITAQIAMVSSSALTLVLAWVALICS